MAHIHPNGKSYFCGKIKDERERKEKKRAFPLDQSDITPQANISHWIFCPVEKLLCVTFFT